MRKLTLDQLATVANEGHAAVGREMRGALLCHLEVAQAVEYEFLLHRAGQLRHRPWADLLADFDPEDGVPQMTVERANEYIDLAQAARLHSAEIEAAASVEDVEALLDGLPVPDDISSVGTWILGERA